MMDFRQVETDLAKEIQKRKFSSQATGVENKRICQQSEEIKDLMAKIKKAYMNKERAAQMHEKQVREIKAIREESQMDQMMLNAREHEKQIQAERLSEQRKEMLKAKQILFRQMEDKMRQVEEAKEQYLIEKVQVNDIVNRIKQDEQNKAIDYGKKQKQCYQDMLDSLQDKRNKIQREQDLEDEENRRYLAFLAKKQQRQKQFAQQKEEVERAKEKIFNKLKTEQEERDRKNTEWEQLMDELYREQAEKKARVLDQMELDKKEQQKIAMKQAEIIAHQMRQEVLNQQQAEKEEFQRIMLAKFESDEKIEKMNAQKRKKELLEHRKEIERLWQAKIQKFQKEKEKEIKAFKHQQALERRKQQIIEQEKERLLREHLPYIQDFLPKGLLEKPDPNKVSAQGQSGGS